MTILRLHLLMTAISHAFQAWQPGRPAAAWLPAACSHGGAGSGARQRHKRAGPGADLLILDVVLQQRECGAVVRCAGGWHAGCIPAAALACPPGSAVHNLARCVRAMFCPPCRAGHTGWRPFGSPAGWALPRGTASTFQPSGGAPAPPAVVGGGSAVPVMTAQQAEAALASHAAPPC